MFIDHATISVKGGNGGSGCVSFRREKHVPKGGPNGGDGGKGGDVVIQAASQLSTLLDFRYRPNFKADRATHGQGSDKHGKGGKNLIVKVPLGTSIKENGKIISDLVEEGQSIIVAKGGRGGRGNARFVTSTTQAPRDWEPGEFGEEKTLELELKLIADVGLVGLPNAGKSTLISKFSEARPKIADYPFTTLKPNLGIVRYRDIGTFVMADIPGIIEGAHFGKGLGLEFLRHIERNKLLLILVDCTSENLNKELSVLLGELKQYNPKLLKRPRFILLTKIDLCPDEDFTEFEQAIGMPVLKISSVTGTGLSELKDMIWEELQRIESNPRPSDARSADLSG